MEPVPVPGSNSYTIKARKELVVQFPLQSIDLRLQNEAAGIHGTKYVVPFTHFQSEPCTFQRTEGNFTAKK